MPHFNIAHFLVYEQLRGEK